MLILVPSAARAAAGTFTLGLTPGVLGVVPSAAVIRSADIIRAAEFVLDVTAAATEAGDTLDVYLQSSPDGVIWDDFVHFTQVLGSGGPKKYIAEWSRDVAPETEMHAPQDGAIAAGVKQGPVGTEWRAKWVLVDVATLANMSFTFSVGMRPFYQPL